jgi:hypothetical protein
MNNDARRQSSIARGRTDTEGNPRRAGDAIDALTPPWFMVENRP